MRDITDELCYVLKGQFILGQWQRLGIKNEMEISGLKAQFKLPLQGEIKDLDLYPRRRPQIFGLCHWVELIRTFSPFRKKITQTKLYLL